MKKKLFSAVLLLALVTAPVASHAGFFDFFRTTSYSNSAQVRSSVLAYKKGDKADIILQVQKILAEQKMYDGDLSGLIGPKTELSIKAWQKAHGLPVSGLLDAETITSILGRGGESVGGNRDGIQCAGSAPQIMVTSPNGGESYQIGGQIEVTWETCNIPASELVYITIGTSANGQGHTFLTTGGTGTPNDGSETFTLSDTLPAGQYYVSAFRPAPNYLRDFSDNSFTLEAPMACIPGGEQWIHLTSPNGGEVYNVGQNINVTWESCNIPANELLEINIHGTGTAIGFLVPNGTPNDGSQVVAQDRPVGTYYINIGTPLFPGQLNNSAMAIYDQSDSNFSIGAGQVGCDSDQVVVSIAGDTPAGVQNINQFNVLKFTIENESNCDVRLEDLKLAYMTTDGKPYFDEIQVRDEQNNFLGENDDLQEDLNLDIGERISIPIYPALQINAGDSEDLILRLVNYNQPVFDNTVPYNDYSHKYLLFGFINEDDFDFKWTTPQSPSFNGTLDPYNNGWGKMVRIPITSLQP